MKALVKAFAKPGLWMEDVPKPTIANDEVLIKIKKTSICGTDLHIYKWDKWAQHTIPVPMVIGHEYVGVIAEVGKYVKNLKVGDRVSGEGHITCRHCRQCRCEHQHLCPHTKGTGVNIPGCFAEYFALPARNVCPLPDDISDDIGSFLDPLGNAVHTALSFDMAGEDVLITGAGPIGIMAVAICKYIGAHNIVISDVNEYRLNMAKKMGATHAINVKDQSLPDALKKINIPDGFGVGLEMSGNSQAIRDMISLVTNGGKIALLGISPDDDVTINWNEVVFKGLFLKGIYGREMFSTWYKMIALLQSGLPIAPVATHHFSADDFQKGFDVMLSGQCGKVVLSWE